MLKIYPKLKVIGIILNTETENFLIGKDLEFVELEFNDFANIPTIDLIQRKLSKKVLTDEILNLNINPLDWNICINIEKIEETIDMKNNSCEQTIVFYYDTRLIEIFRTENEHVAEEFFLRKCEYIHLLNFSDIKKQIDSGIVYKKIDWILNIIFNQDKFYSEQYKKLFLMHPDIKIYKCVKFGKFLYYHYLIASDENELIRYNQ